MHTRLSGVADHLAQDETHALALARGIVSHLNRHKPPYPVRAVAPPLTLADGWTAGRIIASAVAEGLGLADVAGIVTDVAPDAPALRDLTVPILR